MFLQYTHAKNINKYKEEFKKSILLKEDFNEYLIRNNVEFINNEIKEFVGNNKFNL